MHYQLYDDEEEFEPRVIPKPITKHDVSCFFKYMKLSNVYLSLCISCNCMYAKDIAEIIIENLHSAL